MARWTGEEYNPRVLAAADEWKRRCLIETGGLFSDRQLWTLENLTELRARIADNPLSGSQTFYSKLERQLRGALPQIPALAAEVLWILLLFSHASAFSPDKKRERIGAVLALSGAAAPEGPLLADDVLHGVGNPGAAFNARLPDELVYILSVFVAFKSLPAGQRSSLLSETGVWDFCELVTGVPGGDVRSARHTLLYLCFPDSFERITSREHKRRIHETFADRLNGGEDPYAANPTPCNRDRALSLIRAALSTELETSEFDYYLPPLRDQWYPSKRDGGTVEEQETATPVPRVWVEKTIVRGRPDRNQGPHRLGEALWSPQRGKGGRDIYANMRRVEPGDVVLHLTDNSGITGVSRVDSEADDSFEGVPGTDWGPQPSYRIQLTDFVRLSPPLNREALFENETTAKRLREIAETERGSGLFYNSVLELNQGAYITEAPPSLVQALSSAYEQIAGEPLPKIPSYRTHAPTTSVVRPFTLDDALKSLFLERGLAKSIIEVWHAKKNVILQGPPGVGKSFSASKLAYALMGSEDDSRIEFVQFHQSYSYEDFVQGYRPTPDGFALRDGHFFSFCERARKDSSETFVFIVDEINRGNLSKIFGELMLLIEADKRGPKWSVRLSYADEGADPFFVPENVYLLGLMNTADRSLAVVDYALRRRFAFFDLQPQLQSESFASAFSEAGGSDRLLSLIRGRVGELNEHIASDTTNLGPGFLVGHSFFCPTPGTALDMRWYRAVIETEIVPLLREYWFDNPARVEEWRGRLLDQLQ